MRMPNLSDLTDEQWAIIAPLIPVHTAGRPRTDDMREVLDAIFDLNRSGKVSFQAGRTLPLPSNTGKK